MGSHILVCTARVLCRGHSTVPEDQELLDGGGWIATLDPMATCPLSPWCAVRGSLGLAWFSEIPCVSQFCFL